MRQGGKHIAKRAGRFLKLTDGDAFPTKSSGAPNDHPNSSEGGNLRTKGKSNMGDWRGVVSPPQLGIALFKGAFLFLVDGGFCPKSTGVKAMGKSVFGKRRVCAQKAVVPKLYEIGA